jgi:probable rRNA maturation factor
MAERMLRELCLETAELSLLLTDDLQMHRLNQKHRQKNGPTDVLSFPLMGEDEEVTLERAAIGDVVISIDTAQRQADREGIELVDEVRRLLAHGLLHLLGYDHQTDAEEAEMDAVAQRLIEASRNGAGLDAELGSALGSDL